MAGKAVLVTGAASGIGRAAALRLADEGGRIAVTDVDGDGAERVAGEIRAAGGTAHAATLDVTDEAAWDAVVADVVARWSGLDVLVANAGISFGKQVAEMALEEWRRVLAINLDGVFLGVRAAVRAMRERGRGGGIVVVSSASGLRASAGASAYCASKAAVRMLADTVALECARDGIRVNTVHPGGVETPLWSSMPFFADLVAEHGEAGAWSALAQGTPMGRFATAAEVAEAILFLASDAASYVTGTGLAVDGGYTA